MVDKKPDFLTSLPDEVLSIIISKLPIDECVRTSVLSKKWISIWKTTMHMEIHLKCLVFPSSLRQHPYANVDIIGELLRADNFRLYEDRVLSVLNSHSAGIRSINLVHFTENLIMGDVERWVCFLVDEVNKIEHLSLECEPEDLPADSWFFPISGDFNLSAALPPGIFSFLASLELSNYFIQSASPFEGCQRLKTLKLKRILLDDQTLSGILEICNLLEKFKLSESTGFQRLNIQNRNLKILELSEFCVEEMSVLVEGLQVLILGTLFCPAKKVLIDARSLNVFRFHYTMVNPGRVYAKILTNQAVLENNTKILTNQAILENCSDLFQSKTRNIFKYLSTLSIALDLNNIREALALSFVINSCVNLQSLEIVLPVRNPSEGENGNSDGCFLPYPKSKFWKIRGIPDRLISKLKYVTVSGFEGTEQEVGFVEELMTTAVMMRRITIFCSCKVEEATLLLSQLPKASGNLSIELMPNNNIVA